MNTESPNYQKAIETISKVVKLDKLDKKSKKELYWLRAGLQAESQVAYQLKSYFGNDDHFCVLNNFSFVLNDQMYQIDHMVLSHRAIYLIESKSVSDVITVNEYEEWFRGKYKEPMNSPVSQVARQREGLEHYLYEHRDAYFAKLLGLRKNLNALIYKCYVAVSEKGKITGKGRKKQSDTVLKFDAIALKIKATHKELNPGDVQLAGQFPVDTFKGARITRTIVGWNSNAE